MAELTQSYAHGVSMTPLIGETIGVHFDQAAETLELPATRLSCASKTSAGAMAS